MSFYQRFVTAGSLLALVACSAGEDAETKDNAEYAKYDNAQISAIVEAGDYDLAQTILLAQERMGVADIDDYWQLLQIRLERLDGIGAEAALEKLLMAQVPAEKLLLANLKILVLQNRLNEAGQLLKTAKFEEQDLYEVSIIRGDIARIQGNPEDALKWYELSVKQNSEDFRGHLSLALFHLGVGNMAAADQAAQAAYGLNPDDSITVYVMGALARYQGQLDDALLYMQKAIELRKTNIQAHIELAGIYLDQGKREEAEQQLDAVYALSPDNVMARYYSALILAQDGKLEAANRLLLLTGNLAQNYMPAARVYGLVSYQLNKCPLAIRPLGSFLSAAPNDRVVKLAYIDCLIREGRVKEATAQLAPMIEDGSTDQEAYLLAASASASQGKIESALKYFERVQALEVGQTDPDRKQFLQTRVALSRYLTGDIAKAIEELVALNKDDPANIETLILLANVQLEAGDMVAATETAKRIEKIDPLSATADNLMGVIEYRQRNLEQAFKYYDAALTKNPEYMSALKNRGVAYVAERSFEKARPDLEAALAKNPEDAVVHAMIGRTYLELGNAEKGLLHLKRAEVAFPNSAIILADHAEALAKMGFTASAITKAVEARKYAEGDVDFLAYLNQKIDQWTVAQKNIQALKDEKSKGVKDAVTQKLKEEADGQAEDPDGI